MTEAEKGAITAISDLAGPTEDAAFREYCTNQGVWKPEDLLYLNLSTSATWRTYL